MMGQLSELLPPSCFQHVDQNRSDVWCFTKRGKQALKKSAMLSSLMPCFERVYFT